MPLVCTEGEEEKQVQSDDVDDMAAIFREEVSLFAILQ